MHAMSACAPAPVILDQPLDPQLTPAGIFSGSGSIQGVKFLEGSGDGSTNKTRASQLGSHQFHRPKLLTRAGTSKARMMVASMRMPTPSAVPRT